MKLTYALPEIALLMLGYPCFAQNQDSRAEFEAPTIRLVKLESRQFPPTALRRDPVRIAYSYVTLGDLVRRAYDLPPYRIEWPERLADTSRGFYSIEATFPEGTTNAQVRACSSGCWGTGLRFGRIGVNRSLSAYELKTAAGGSRIRPSKYDPAGDRLDPNDETERNRYTIFQGPNGWRITGVISLRQLTGTLGGDLGRPMIDKTGLQGYYDIDFTWNRPTLVGLTPPGQPPLFEKESIPESSKTATLFPALEKQLGLKAEPTKWLSMC